MIPSKNFIFLCHGSEGCKLTAYQDDGGIWTIGWGHTFGVKKGMVITQDQADQFFYQDCEFFIDWLNRHFPILSQNWFDTILDLIYNIGPGNLSKDAELYNAIQNKDECEIKLGFMRHVHDAKGIVEPGLITRRENELKLMFG